MPRYSPVTRERHGGKSWRRLPGYAFAAGELVAPVAGAELAYAATAMPLAFVEQNGVYALVSVLSLLGRNMFVAPDGRWLGSYVPAIFRAYPFRLLQSEARQDWVLCIDEDAKSITDAAAGGEPFFDEQGELAPRTKAVVQFLGPLARNNIVTTGAVSALAGAGVLHAWPIKVKVGDKERVVAGLHCVNETVLNGLDDEAFRRLRKASALPVAYAQLLSMSRLSVFQELAKAQEEAARVAPPVPNLPESFDTAFELPSDETIKFK
jgi:hypothetical protein